MNVDSNKANQPSYILWLIRDGHVHNWGQLCEHFGWSRDGSHTGHSMLDDSLRSLKHAGLIVEGRNGTSFRVTGLVSRLQTSLGVSIAELAKCNSRNSFVVSTIFDIPRGNVYSYDLFVLMPFKPELHPVFEDHIKNVAKELEMKVARADDFFSTKSIMQDVWSAILQSKFIIADCTGRNPNAFYETGIAHTMGKSVVLITQNTDDVPFDLRHLRYIKYEYTPRGMKDFEVILQKTLSNLMRG